MWCSIRQPRSRGLAGVEKVHLHNLSTMQRHIFALALFALLTAPVQPPPHSLPFLATGANAASTVRLHGQLVLTYPLCNREGL